MKKSFKYAFVGVVVAFLIAIIHFANTRTFRGRVIDADTKQPIEGAVVVVHWYKARYTFTGETTTLKDVKECLTDKNGRWSITGPKGRNDWPIPLLSVVIPYTREPQFIVFKPGYCSWPNGSHIEACKGKMKFSASFDTAEGASTELPKLTKRVDRIEAQSISIPTGEHADEKCRELIRLMNEEGRSLGLGEIYK